MIDHGIESLRAREKNADVKSAELVEAKYNTESSREKLSEWVQERLSARARTASPVERLGDALASLQYLLVSEAPRLVVGATRESKDRKEALLLLLRVVSKLLPNLQNIRNDPTRLESLWLDVSAATRWVEERHSDYQMSAKEWKQGITAALTGRRGRHFEPTWRVCGLSTTNSTSSADKAYTCGLWLLTHFMTVAGGRGDNVSAAQVESAIHGLVSHLFTCSLCRKHFLETFNNCSFGRCSNGEGESSDLAFARLQLWLFRVHNAVTARIYREQGAGDEEDFRTVLWPSTSVNLGSQTNTIVEPLLVLKHLRQSYWEEKQWGELNPFPSSDYIQ